MKISKASCNPQAYLKTLSPVKFQITFSKQCLIKALILQKLINKQTLFPVNTTSMQLHEISMLHSRYSSNFCYELILSMARSYGELFHCNQSPIIQCSLIDSSKTSFAKLI
uniref:Uncharacterized protein n=1 Tax=Opuntia streptacantha TaxID=393608 RepID=A0A7C9E2Q4_OPUST